METGVGIEACGQDILGFDENGVRISIEVSVIDYDDYGCR